MANAAPAVLPIAPAAPAVAPAGMANLVADPTEATGWLSNHRNPNQDQQDFLFNQVFPDLNEIFVTCGLLRKQRIAILCQGIVTIEDLPLLGRKLDNIRDIFKGYNALPDNRGGVIFGAVQYARIFAAVLFVRDKQRRGIVPIPGDFTADVLAEFSELALSGLDDDEIKVSDPPTLTDSNFLEWEDALLTKLGSKQGQRGVPLAYVVRRPLPPGRTIDDITEATERLLHETTHAGASYRRDNIAVGQYIKGILAGTDATAWIESNLDSNDGNAMMDDLRTHYLGASQVEKIIEAARNSRDAAHYKSEGTYTFQKFSTDLKRSFTTLRRYDNEVPEAEQVRLLRDKIHTSNAGFDAAVQIKLMDGTVTTFDQGVAEVNRLVSHFFGETKAPSKKNVRFRVSGVTAKDFADRHANGKSYCAGVDITDFGRWFDNAEFNKLPQDLKKAIREHKKKKGKGPKRSNGDNGGSGNQRKQIKKLKATVSAMERRMSDLQGDGDAGTQGQNAGTNGGQNNTNTGNGGNNQGAEGVGPAQFANPRERGGRNGGAGNGTSVRAVNIFKLKRNTPKVANETDLEAEILTAGRLDEDSHADMHCAGANFVPLAFTNYTCDVDPFLEAYESTTNVPIVKAATACEVTSGNVIYLVMNSALWFGKNMATSLFNANVARDAGVDICTDPYDKHRRMGIMDESKQLYLPLDREGNTVGLRTYKPEADDVLRAISVGGDNVIFLDSSDGITLLSGRQLDVMSFGIQGEPEVDPTDEHHREHLLRDTISSVHDPCSFAESMIANINVIDTDKTKIGAFQSKGPHSKISPERVSDIFGCGIEAAKNTLRVTTQYCTRSAVHPLRRRYRTDLLSLHYRRLDKPMFCDVAFFKQKSLNQNTCAGIYTSMDFVKAYPMRSKKFMGDSLRLLAEDVGVPNQLRYDNAKEMTEPGTMFQKTARYLRIRCSTIEAHTSRQSKSERVIGELRRRWRDVRRKKNMNRRLWDFALVWVAEIMSRTWNAKTGRTGIEVITGDTPDISEWIDFDMYDRIWYWDSPHDEVNPKPGRWLGISHRVGSALCYYVIAVSGEVLSRTSVQHVTEDELQTDAVRKTFDDFDDALGKKLPDEGYEIRNPNDLYFEDIDLGEIDEAIDNPAPVDPDAVHGDNEEGNDTTTTFDPYIGAEILLEPGPDGALRRGTVLKRARTADGNLKGTRHGNPYLDTARYDVDIDGIRQEYAANQIAENLYSQCDEEGRQQLLYKAIIDHKKGPDAIEKADGKITTQGGQERNRITTKGWEIKVEWKDGTASWLPLTEVKEANPVELAEYAVLSKIDQEPAFAWWVPFTIKRRNKIIAKVKGKYWRTSHKFGIKLPHSVEEAYRIDRENGNDYWTKSIEKEMARVRVAFEKWEGGTTKEEALKKLVGYEYIKCHMIFDVRIDGLVRKSRLVAGGHMTDTPSSVTYSSVVSRDSVRIAFLYAALNDLSLTAADIGNAYLNAPNRERNWTVAGKEFGEDEGTVYIVVRALYGLKAAGASWRAFFAQIIEDDLGFKPTRGDPDVYIRKATNPDGTQYYEMLLCYVDDILLASKNPDPTIEQLQTKFRLKADSLGAPTRYLGAQVKVFTDDHGKECYGLSSDDYVKNAVKEVEAELDTIGLKLKGKAYRPFPQTYKPEVDISPLLNEEGIQKYQGYMGIFRWMIELGRIDIITEVSQLSSFQAMPREGHLEAVYSMFAYLRIHPHMSILMHPSRPTIYQDRFNESQNWKDFYGDIKEDIPSDMPEPLGKPVKITCFVDADHAGNVVTRRSQTGYIIYLNNAPILWYSKKQSTVEASTFGSEFIAMRTITEVNDALRFKLRMFGIPIDGPSDILCDNQSVVNSGSKPDSTLSKKHLSICYHRVREAVTRECCRIGKVTDAENVADLFTKILGVPKRDSCLAQICWRESRKIRPIDQHKDVFLNRQAQERAI